MKKFFKRIWDLIVWCWNNPVLKYIFLGGCATLVNLASYYVLRLTTNLNLNTANIISVFLAMMFAYYTNSKFVFESQADSFKDKFREFCKFVSARLVTMVVEVGGVWLMSDIMHINDYIAKFVIQFIVLVLNYIFSKFFVFKKEEPTNDIKECEE